MPHQLEHHKAATITPRRCVKQSALAQGTACVSRLVGDHIELRPWKP